MLSHRGIPWGGGGGGAYLISLCIYAWCLHSSNAPTMRTPLIQLSCDDSSFQCLPSLSEGGNGSFPYHRRPDPTVSNSPVNPVTSVGKVGVDIVSANLIRAHGILMIIAYPVLAVTAIFIVTWMKPALPNGEWFQVSILPSMS